MKNYEKSSFYKIFFGFFISASIFILLLGFLYFEQHRNLIIQKTAMNMHQYLLQIKETNFNYQQDGYSYTISNTKKVEKELPRKKGDKYFKAFSNKFIINIDAKIVDDEIETLKVFTIILQVFLIVIFSFISYILAKKSLKPMVDTISHLDRFIGDLIHDLNTPITSILLNTRMLRKDINNEGLKKINRIENSANNISFLYENLEILLGQNAFQKIQLNIFSIINETISTYQNLYTNIKFNIEYDDKDICTNDIAITRILDNIISNACKYSIDENPYIKIICKNNQLIIQDNGKGIKYPKNVFERNYTENQSGYGIGMHIVYRLCNELGHSISIESKEHEGTKVIILF